MFSHNHVLLIASLNAQGSRRAIYGCLEDGYDIVLLQEIPWTPWRIRTKDVDLLPLENITVFDKRYKNFHAPLTSPFKIRTLIYIKKELLKYGTFTLTSFSEWHTTIQWRTATKTTAITSVYGNVHKRDEVVSVIQGIMAFSG